MLLDGCQTWIINKGEHVTGSDSDALLVKDAVNTLDRQRNERKGPQSRFFF